MSVVDCPCAVPGCGGRARLKPLRTAIGPLDMTEGLCAHHMSLAAPDRVLVLRAARLDLMASPGLAEIVLFVRAWEAVKMSAIERSVARAPHPHKTGVENWSLVEDSKNLNGYVSGRLERVFSFFMNKFGRRTADDLHHVAAKAKVPQLADISEQTLPSAPGNMRRSPAFPQGNSKLGIQASYQNGSRVVLCHAQLPFVGWQR